ncbi:MAG: hypothetical protein BGO78_02260 [Chloroflexi bacterium 44-23]|nr:MAG: hypothetical protein BGO78_02260 [Chloroflexi bacterium 44-23]
MKDENVYEIHIEGILPDRWSEWFEGLKIELDSIDQTILSGSLVDQAALFGVLNKIHSLNLNLISVSRKNCLDEESK